MKAEIEVRLGKIAPFYCLWSSDVLRDAEEYGIWEQLVAIVLGWADPVEVE